MMGCFFSTTHPFPSSARQRDMVSFGVLTQTHRCHGFPVLLLCRSCNKRLLAVLLLCQLSKRLVGILCRVMVVHLWQALSVWFPDASCLSLLCSRHAMSGGGNTHWFVFSIH